MCYFKFYEFSCYNVPDHHEHAFRSQLALPIQEPVWELSGKLLALGIQYPPICYELYHWDYATSSSN